MSWALSLLFSSRTPCSAMVRRMVEITQSLSTTEMYWASRKTLWPASGRKSTQPSAASQVPVSRSCSVPVRGVPVTFTLVQPAASTSPAPASASADRRINKPRRIVDCHPEQGPGTAHNEKQNCILS